MTLTHRAHPEVEAAVGHPGAEQARALSAPDVGHAVRLLRVPSAPISAAAVAILLLGDRLLPDRVFGSDLRNDKLSPCLYIYLDIYLQFFNNFWVMIV